MSDNGKKAEYGDSDNGLFTLEELGPNVLLPAINES